MISLSIRGENMKLELNKAKQSTVAIDRLFDEVMTSNNLKNDAALSYFLHVAPPVISKMRNGSLPLGDSMVLKLHELGGLSVRHIRKALEVTK
jgi:hypothetical protein